MKYRIGSFNMRNWGKTSKRDFAMIANIIASERLDIVAFQEILSEGAGLKRWLEQCVKYQLHNWDMCWDAPREPGDSDKVQDMIRNDRRGEGYAYIWNKQKFQLAEVRKLGKKHVFSPRIVNALSRDVPSLSSSFFARTPYYIRLQPCNGGFFDLRLINIHIYYGSNALSDVEKRKLEFHVLANDVYPAISQQRYGDFRPAYTIAMGDYNLNIFRPWRTVKDKNSNLQEIVDVPQYGKVVTDQEQLSTLQMSERNSAEEHESGNIGANNYDHFTYKDGSISVVSCAAIQAVEKYCNGDLEHYRKNISDHLPVVLEIAVGNTFAANSMADETD